MQHEIEQMEMRVRLQKLNTAKDEYELQKLKLLQKVAKLDEELVVQQQAIDKLEKEMISTEGVNNVTN